MARLEVLLDLGLGYLTLERNTPTLSPGELQRLRLATQVRSNLFGVVYVLDEPSAGLHPADTEALLRALDRLKASGNSLFVVEHDLDVIRRADWIVDVGPGAGDGGGQVLYSGAPEGLRGVEASATRRHLFADEAARRRTPREPRGWLKLAGVTRNNLRGVDVGFPLGVFTSVTGVSGSGKSSLVSQSAGRAGGDELGAALPEAEEDEADALLDDAAGRRPRGGSSAGWRGSGGWSRSTRSRSAGRRGRTWRRTPGCSTRSASRSPPRPRRGAGVRRRAGSRSTSPRGAARGARGKAR